MPKLYENNPSLPIFRSENAPCYTNEIVGIILEETFSQDLVATMTPLRVMQNASFLIDWTKIGHWKDPLSDMLGHWNHTKTKRFFFDAKNPKSIKITMVMKGLLLLGDISTLIERIETFIAFS